MVAIGTVGFAGIAAADEHGGVLTVDDSLDGDGEYEYTSIQAAIDDADSGDTIEVKEGTYDESVTIETEGIKLTSSGDAEDTTIIYDGSGANPAVTINDDGVTLNGFTVERTGAADDAPAQAIYVNADTGSETGVSGVTIENNIVKGETDSSDENDQNFGIYVDDEGWSIHDDGVTIDENSVSGFSSGVLITTGYGSDKMDNIEVTNNVIEDNAFGVTVSNFDDGPNPNVDITNNDIKNNDDFGIRIPGEGDTTFTFEKNDIDLSEISTNQNNIVGNGGTGLKVAGDGTLDATSNWWGSDDGPSGAGPGEGDSISADFDPDTNELVVEFDPWLDDLDGDIVDRVQIVDGDAFSSIQGAVRNANQDDVIEVEEGTHKIEDLIEIETEGVTLESAGTPDATIIEAETGIALSAADTTIDGFTVNTEDPEFVIFANSDATGTEITNNVINPDSSEEGNGILSRSGEVTIEENDVSGIPSGGLGGDITLLDADHEFAESDEQVSINGQEFDTDERAAISDELFDMNNNVGIVQIEDAEFDASTDESIADVDIEHDSNSGGARGTGPDPSLVAEKLNVVPVNSEDELLVGGDADATFEIENTDGDIVTIKPADDAEIVDATSVEFDIYGGDGELRDPPELVLSTDDVEDGSVTVDATVSGDTSMFADGVADSSDEQSDPFGEYEVRLLDSNDETVDSTDQRLIGIGYNVGDGIQQNGTTGEIEFTVPSENLNEGVDADWSAQFTLEDLVSDDEPRIGPIDVENNEGDEQFQFTVDVSDLPNGEYDASLELYSTSDREAAFGDFDDRVVNIFEVEEIVIEGGPQVTFDATSPASENSPADFSINTEQEVETADIEIRDNDDEVVFEQDITNALEDEEDIEWDTTDQDGEVADDGSYDAVLTVEDEDENEVTATDTIEVDNTAPIIENVQVDGETDDLDTGESVTVTADVTAENTDADVFFGLASDFTSSTTDEKATVTIEDGETEVSTTIEPDDVIADGDFTAFATAEDEAGNTDNAEGPTVTFDTTPPEIQLAADDLGTDDATVEITADEPVTVEDLDIDVDSNDETPELPEGESNEFTIEFDGSFEGEATTKIDATVEDIFGNEESATLESTTTNYEIDPEDEGNVEVDPETDTIGSNYGLAADLEAIGEDFDRSASLSESTSAPSGTELADSQFGSAFADVNDIGLEDDELTEADVRIPVENIDNVDEDTDNPVLFYSPDDDDSYETRSATIEDGMLVGTVPGFSQVGGGVEDTDPPTITDQSGDTELEAGETATVKFDYEAVGSDIKFGADDTDLSVSGESESIFNTFDIADEFDSEDQEGTAVAEIESVEAGASFTVELSVVDDGGNENSESVSVTVADEEEEEEEDTSTGGGGGGGGGASTPTDDTTDDTPSATADVTDAISQSEPDRESEIVIEDANPEVSGVTIDTSADSDSVREITFTDDDVEGSVSIEDYSDADVLETSEQSIEQSLDADVAGESDDEVADDETSSVSVTRLARISPDNPDRAATITMSTDADDVTDPESVTIYHGTDDGWEELSTDVVEVTNEEVILSAETDGFSLFTVGEVEADVTDEDDDVPIEESEETDDSIPGFGVLVALVALIGAALLAVRRQN